MRVFSDLVNIDVQIADPRFQQRLVQWLGGHILAGSTIWKLILYNHEEENILATGIKQQDWKHDRLLVMYCSLSVFGKTMPTKQRQTHF